MLSDANDLVTDDDDYDYNEMDDSNNYDVDNDMYDDLDEDDNGCDDSRGSEDDNISSSYEEDDGSDNNGTDISDNWCNGCDWNLTIANLLASYANQPIMCMCWNLVMLLVL